ncbi:MAG: helix-hairpin-helix domain-containing protein [Bacteroidales bacterium]|nr:helix-hairpin-helix domain-containing protein [Bacteroidales bacterium]
MSGEKSCRKPDRSNKYGEKGSSRSRNIGVFVLMLALFIFQVTMFVHEKFFQKEEGSAVAVEESEPANAPFFFDPNTITLDSLCMLGLTPRQAQTILNYRNKGGRFRRPEDFSRMYVVSEELYLRVKPFIAIASESQDPKRKYQVANAGAPGRPGAGLDSNLPQTGTAESPDVSAAMNTDVRTAMNTDVRTAVAQDVRTAIKTDVRAAVGQNVKAIMSAEGRIAMAPDTRAAMEPGVNQKTDAQDSDVAECKGSTLEPQTPGSPAPAKQGRKQMTYAPDARETEPRSARVVVDLNLADSAALVKLYGIGPFYAKRIIEYRRRLGGFHSVGQLMEIPGIDTIKFEGLARSVVADPVSIRRFRLDTAGKRFLMAHPYIGAYAARGILLLRQKLGNAACTLENLVKERIISSENAMRLWPYIE